MRVEGIDARFDAIVDRALQTDPELRYASATELQTDLERIISEPAGPSELAAVAEVVEPTGGELGGNEAIEDAADGDESAEGGPIEQEVFPSIAEPIQPETGPVSPRAGGWSGKAMRLVGSAVAALAAGLLQMQIPRQPTQMTEAPELEENGSVAVAEASKDRPFITALGMKFVPVPIPPYPDASRASGAPGRETRVLFCTCETQVEEYALF